MTEIGESRPELPMASDGLLVTMPDGPRSRLLAIAHAEAYPAGAEILAEGRDTPFLGFVEDGRVALRLRVPERGERLTFVTIEPGELLGWSALVPPYRATVEAISTEDTRILAIDAGELRALFVRDDEVAAAMLPVVLNAVSARLTGSWHQLLDTFCARTYGPW
jgi:CRP-like cAMP-binding protein